MIEIQRLEKLENKGALCAKFNVKMHKWGGVILKELTLFDSNGKRWINLPSRQYEADGKKKYVSYMEYEDRDMNDKFKATILEALDVELKKENTTTKKPDYVVSEEFLF